MEACCWGFEHTNQAYQSAYADDRGIDELFQNNINNRMLSPSSNMLVLKCGKAIVQTVSSLPAIKGANQRCIGTFVTMSLSYGETKRVRERERDAASYFYATEFHPW